VQGIYVSMLEGYPELIGQTTKSAAMCLELKLSWGTMQRERYVTETRKGRRYL
jgi:hypothetical protein